MEEIMKVAVNYVCRTLRVLHAGAFFPLAPADTICLQSTAKPGVYGGCEADDVPVWNIANY